MQQNQPKLRTIDFPSKNEGDDVISDMSWISSVKNEEEEIVQDNQLD